MLKVHYIIISRQEPIINSSSSTRHCGELKQTFATNLQEYSNNSEPIRLASSLTETGVFGVPVHQMELGTKKTDQSDTLSFLGSLLGKS